MIDFSHAPSPMPPGFDWLRAECDQRGGQFIETRHHVISYIPGAAQDRLLVGFDNLASAGEVEQREPWAYGLAQARGWGSLGVMIKRKDWFRCPDLWATMERLRDEGLFTKYSAVSMYGSSMGGFGAALFAPLAPGCTVLAMAPQTTLARDIAPFETRYRHALSFADWSGGPMRDAAQTIGAAGKAYILYDPEVPEDKAHAERLRGGNVELLPCAYMTHKLPPMFRRMGILKDIAHQGLTGTLTRAGFYTLLRKRRMSTPYILSLCEAAGKRGHARLAMRAVDGALARGPNWKLRQLRRHLRTTPTPPPPATAITPDTGSDMSTLPVISSLWIGRPFSYLEQLCMKSFVDRGHRTKLYVYDDVGNVPEGVEIADANDILPTDEFVVNKATGNPGPQSDKFRYHLMNKTDEVWVDTDAYCLRPFPNRPVIVACHFKDVVANGVLRLPKTSKTLQDLIDFTSDEYPLLPADFPYVGRALLKENRDRHGTDNPMHVSEMPWEIWGPFAITYFMKKNGEFDQVMPRETLYPLGGGEIVRVLQMPRRAKIELPENCLSIHFYGSRFRELVRDRDQGVPATATLLGQLLIEHDIDPAAAPI